MIDCSSAFSSCNWMQWGFGVVYDKYKAWFTGVVSGAESICNFMRARGRWQVRTSCALVLHPLAQPYTMTLIKMRKWWVPFSERQLNDSHAWCMCFCRWEIPEVSVRTTSLVDCCCSQVLRICGIWMNERFNVQTSLVLAFTVLRNFQVLLLWVEMPWKTMW